MSITLKLLLSASITLSILSSTGNAMNNGNGSYDFDPNGPLTASLIRQADVGSVMKGERAARVMSEARRQVRSLSPARQPAPFPIAAEGPSAPVRSPSASARPPAPLPAASLTATTASARLSGPARGPAAAPSPAQLSAHTPAPIRGSAAAPSPARPSAPKRAPAAPSLRQSVGGADLDIENSREDLTAHAPQPSKSALSDSLRTTVPASGTISGDAFGNMPLTAASLTDSIMVGGPNAPATANNWGDELAPPSAFASAPAAEAGDPTLADGWIHIAPPADKPTGKK
jgi:hypothetical protein